MTEMRDEFLDEVVHELRAIPPVDDAAVLRIVSAAAAEARADSARHVAGLSHRSWWRLQVPLAVAAGFAFAAALGGFAARDMMKPAPAPTAIPRAAMVAGESLTSLVSTPAGPRATPASVSTQFILDAPRAQRVALVGDFNAWDADATPLVRDPSSGIWTASVPLAPGRHVYAFMIDGGALTLDPRAATAQDPDFGTPSSVVLVGAP